MRKDIMRLTARRKAANARLAALDRANRCAACRRPLPKTGAWQTFAGAGDRYCSRDCYDDAAEARGEVS